MSDIKLFETVGSVKELLSSKVHLEKDCLPYQDSMAVMVI